MSSVLLHRYQNEFYRCSYTIHSTHDDVWIKFPSEIKRNRERIFSHLNFQHSREKSKEKPRKFLPKITYHK